MPGLARRALNFAAALGRRARALASGQPVVADPLTRFQRLLDCGNCPYREFGRCGRCGCPLAAKARWATETCPDNRWRS